MPEQANRGFNVSRFRSAVNHEDLLRNNKFMMEFTIPIGLQAGGAGERTAKVRDTVRYLEFYAETVNAPGLNLMTTEGRKYTWGPVQKRPYVTQYNDLAVTFYDDGGSYNWEFFKEWMRLINYSVLSKSNEGISDGEAVNGALGGTVTYPYELAYRNDYVTDARLLVFRNTGAISKVYELRELYPIAMADQAFNWSDTNSLLKLSMNFTFLEWYEVALSTAEQQYTK